MTLPKKVDEAIQAFFDESPIPPAVLSAHITPVLHRTIPLFGDLPASAEHHHAEPYGLLFHTIDVVRKIQTGMRKIIFVRDPLTTEHAALLETQWRCGAILAGLCHDLGKVDYDWCIRTDEGLPFSTCRDVSIEPFTNRELNKDRKNRFHQYFSVCAMSVVIPVSTWTYLTRETTAIYQSMVLSILGEDTSPIGTLLSQADASSVMKDREDKPLFPPSIATPENNLQTPQSILQVLKQQLLVGHGTWIIGPVLTEPTRIVTTAKVIDHICRTEKQITRPFLIGLLRGPQQPPYLRLEDDKLILEVTPHDY